MQLKGDAKLLRIFIGDSDKIGAVSLYEKIVLEARNFGLAGATVIKGVMGFGSNSRIHTAKLLRLSEDLPLIIEIVDEIEKIEKFKAVLEKLFDHAGCGGLITIEKAEIIKYTPSKK
jgi:PII-like signaling protein